MEHRVQTPTNPQLSVRLRSDWLAGILRVDAIRQDTLIQLVQHWNSDPDSRDQVISALDELADAVTRREHPDRLQDFCESVEEFAAMDAAEEELSRDCVNRLFRELGDVSMALNRFEQVEHP